MPIPGTSSLARLEENVRAADVALTPAELERIEQFAPHGLARGDRYAPAAQRLLNG